MIYDIVFEPAPVLHARAADVDPKEIATRPLQKFFKDMIETMYVKDGVGLAAVQVDKALQVCAIIKTYNALNPHEDLVLINPSWEKLSRKQAWDEEGCLSVPGLYGKIKRYTKIKVRALSVRGQPVEFVAENFFACIIQHEVDHLRGHLFIEKAKDIHAAEKIKPISKPAR